MALNLSPEQGVKLTKKDRGIVHGLLLWTVFFTEPIQIQHQQADLDHQDPKEGKHKRTGEGDQLQFPQYRDDDHGT